jgi:hypothetical protein
MAVQAEDFLRFAEELLDKRTQTEIDHRNAAARAYYALLHLIRPALGLPTTASHLDVREELKATHPASAAPFLREARLHWREFWKLRLRSDYELSAHVSKATAEGRVELARRIFSLSAL